MLMRKQWGLREDEAYDFIHGRSMGGAIKDWTQLFRQIFNNLKPGGWCEMHEYESWVSNSPTPSWRGS